MEKIPQKSNWLLLPPAPGVCQLCGVDHPPLDPHNQKSLYYQYRFYAEHSRWPTWLDAMSHCDAVTQDNWQRELIAKGEKIE